MGAIAAGRLDDAYVLDLWSVSSTGAVTGVGV
jgi:hypothetical protein